MSVYYAGVGGNDGNAGTSWALRKLTIQAAVNVATTAGDTIYVGPGTYRETVTMAASGTAGNVISLIGDYTGQNTSGTKGVVRITGSNDDISATRASCIIASSKNYITVRGFTMDGCSSFIVSLTTATYFTLDKCSVGQNFCINTYVINCAGASQSNVTISNCIITGSSGGGGILFTHTSTVDNCAHVVENCVVFGCLVVAIGINTSRIGGITVRNCAIGWCRQGVRINPALTVGQTITVNNCVFFGIESALIATTTAEFVENYNSFSTDVATARTNVTAGANSVTRPPLFDTRWFFEMVNGGRMVTPFDLASYSTLVEYNSGTGAPSTDLRGASVVGTYREWGALEYDSTLSIAGGGASRVIGSPFIRGLGAV